MGEFDLTLPPEAAEEYEITACLKRGVDRLTLRLRSRTDGGDAVIKRCSGAQNDLRSEYEMLLATAGPGVPRVYGIYEFDGATYLLREYIEGQTLLDWSQKRGALPTCDVLEAGLAICRILARFHASDPPIIYRDVKSDNIIRTRDGEYFLIDFGIARRFDPETAHDTQALGTPLYSPPEQFGFRQTDTRSDVYAVGVLLHELSTCSVTLDNVSSDPILRPIIDRATRFDPNDRYKDAGELLRALEEAAGPQKRKKSVIVPIVTLAAAVAVVCSVFAVMYMRGGGAPDVPGTSETSGETGSQTAEQQTEPETDAPATESATNAESVPGASEEFHYPGERYRFASPEIEAEVCRQLGMEPGSVTYGDLDKIVSIMICGKNGVENWEDVIEQGVDVTLNGVTVTEYGNIDTLEDIPNFHNLNTLLLCNQKITDVSPLTGCTLTRLALDCNDITDISPLGECEWLFELRLSGNPVSDISPLANLSELSNLSIGCTDVTDLSPLAGMEKLGRLSLMDFHDIKDFSPLESIKSLRSLLVRRLNGSILPEETAVIARLPLTDLYIWHPDGWTDLRPFAEMTELRSLFLHDNELISVEGAGALQNLTFLNILTPNLLDISPLAEMPELSDILVSGIDPIDWGVLKTFPALKRVMCSQEQRPAIEEALAGTDIEVIS